MRTITASELKAKLLAILDQIEESGEGLTVLKRGRPIAQILPALPRENGFPQETLRGTCHIVGDVMAPVLSEREISVLRKRR